MSPDEQVGQLMLVAFDGQAVGNDLREMLGQWHVGGVVLYRRNLTTRAQARRLTHAIRALSSGRSRPLIATDAEGGWVRRLSFMADFPGNMALGAAGSERLAFESGASVGFELLDAGITVNFAPVVDILSEPVSELGTRCFSDDPELVGSLGTAFFEGQSAAGVISVAKHFVGEGSAAGDAHERPLCSAATDADVESRELLPFRRLIASGIPAIMTSHVALPAVTKAGSLPATFSSAVITGLLRHRLGFDGVVITDAIEMLAVRQRGDFSEMAVQAIEAGADIVLSAGTMTDHRHVRDGLLAAVRSGRISPERLRASLRRILRMKHTGERGAARARRPTRARSVVDRIAAESVTIMKEGNGVLPLSVGSREGLVYIGPEGPIAAAIGARALILDRDIPLDQMRNIAARMVRDVGKASLIVAAAQNGGQAMLIERLAASRPAVPLIAISLGNPLDLLQIPSAAAAIAAFSASIPSQRAVAAVLNGKAGARGHLPLGKNELVPIRNLVPNSTHPY